MVSVNVSVVPEQQSSGSLWGIASVYGAFSVVILLAFCFVREQLQGKQEIFYTAVLRSEAFCICRGAWGRIWVFNLFSALRQQHLKRNLYGCWSLEKQILGYSTVNPALRNLFKIDDQGVRELICACCKSLCFHGDFFPLINFHTIVETLFCYFANLSFPSYNLSPTSLHHQARFVSLFVQLYV